MTRPLVAIVGRPNVGKSTLFNRLIGERKALVYNEPGVTRDRHFGKADAYGRPFDLVDTGGFDPDSQDQLIAAMRQQARMAVDAADIIIFVVDGRHGLTHTDEQVYAILRASSQPLFVAANKLDTERLAPNALEFHALGVDRVYPVSAEHGVGLGDLVEALYEALPDPKDADEIDDGTRTRIAIVGRPNAGKSTLVNRILGQPRLITSDIPGTTRDSIDTNLDLTVGEWTGGDEEPLLAEAQTFDDDFAFSDVVFDAPDEDWRELSAEANRGRGHAPVEDDDSFEDEDDDGPWDDDEDGTVEAAAKGGESASEDTASEDTTEGEAVDGDGEKPEGRKLVRRVRKYTLIDTAGIRRRTHIDWAVEKFGVIKAMQSIDRCHVAVLVVDANDGLTDQDARIATRVLETGRGLIIALNKWDSVAKDGKTHDQMAKSIREARPSLALAPILFMSALTGQRTARLLDIADEVQASCRRRITTAALNRWFEQTLRERPPPLYRRRAVRLYYVTQPKARPPTFVFQSNMPQDAFPISYLRMLENRLRKEFGFAGTPLRFIIRQRLSQYADRPPPPKFTKSAK